MSTQHTPGPWTITRESRSPWAIEGPKMDGNALALVYVTDPKTRKRTTEHQANARLIAAAPDLLCMLSRFLDGILRLPEIPPTLCALDIEQARAAITKATTDT